MGGLSIKDIALKLGVSHSTVSRALNGNPRISAVMRKRVRTAAAKLGYVPDARIGELMARVRQGRREGFQGTLGLVYLTGKASELKWRRQVAAYTAGIEERAHHLGYEVDTFWPGETGLTPKRLQTIFRQRGIDGVVLMKPPSQTNQLHLPWESLAWVALGFALQEPPLHMVTPDWTGDAVAATRFLIQAGHTHIGFAWAEYSDPMVGNAWLGGYASEMLANQLVPRIFRSKDDAYEGLVEWIAAEQIDALLVHSNWVRKRLGLRMAGVRLIYLNLSEDQKGSEGVVTSCRESGMNAVDLLVSQLRLGERGVPPFQKKLRTQGRWRES